MLWSSLLRISNEKAELTSNYNELVFVTISLLSYITDVRYTCSLDRGLTYFVSGFAWILAVSAFECRDGTA